MRKILSKILDYTMIITFLSSLGITIYNIAHKINPFKNFISYIILPALLFIFSIIIGLFNSRIIQNKKSVKTINENWNFYKKCMEEFKHTKAYDDKPFKIHEKIFEDEETDKNE